MVNRLTRIVTRTGDDGTTGLADGQRVAKHSPRIELCGAVDDLNCALGVLLTADDLPPALHARLTDCQHELFDLGGELAIPGTALIDDAAVARLEAAVTEMNADLPPLREFVLPGGGSSAAACHMARAICRRAERRGWSLAAVEAVNTASLRYLNRLSDLLFVAARVLARQAGAEVTWRREPRP
jgi:cob(I)alamin adenosyltransferase